MSLIELIGFVITVLALIFLFGKQVYEERKRRRDPEAYRRQQEEKQRVLDELFSELKDERKETIQSFEEEEEIEEWEQVPVSYEVQQTILPKKIVKPPTMKKGPTRIQKMVRDLPNKRDMVVYSSIFGPPKSRE